MILVEKHYIQKTHKNFQECERVALLSKNLYNYANYLTRKQFIENKTLLTASALQMLLKGSQKDYISLPAKVSQQTLRLLEKNWKSFFEAAKVYKKDPSKFRGRPSLPNYKPVKNGRNIAIYNAQAVLIKKIKQGIIILSKTKIELEFQNLHRCKKVKQVRVVPINQLQYCIEIVYELKEEYMSTTNSKHCIGIDLGINNFNTVGGLTITPFILGGGVLKSINQYYNKKKGELQSKLPKGHFSSNRIVRLANKRNHKIADYLHKTSKYLIDYCLTNNIGEIVIGYNEGWKQNVNLGKKNNQNFTNIPFLKFIGMLTYKAEIKGISVKIQEESYTSKCSFLDNEKVCKHKNYQGKRIKRGLFRSATGRLINADLNSVYNILKKAIVNFADKAYEMIEALAVAPVRINSYKL